MKASSQTRRSHAHKGKERRKHTGHHKTSKDAPPLVSEVLTPRVCLRCLEEFPSRGPGNRICDVCTETNKNQGKAAKHRLLSAKGKMIG